ncbi:hypothetical protein [Streptococcus dysgalactiae]|uniref:hypothetical protein n=1 Tax=Streptococcus dysgalactiae TaxID=1334 RepID=UPI00194F930F|nr:hypothetical protein [Streptococcus dysgalactiae subsp. equisimilis]
MVNIEGVDTLAVVDTGAGISVTGVKANVPIRPCTVVARSVGGTQLTIKGKQKLRIRIGDTTLVHDMFVIERVNETIIGIDILIRLKATVNFDRSTIQLSGAPLQLYQPEETRKAQVGAIKTKLLPDCQVKCVRQCLEKYAYVFSTVTATGSNTALYCKRGPGVDQFTAEYHRN